MINACLVRDQDARPVLEVQIVRTLNLNAYHVLDQLI